MTRKRMFRRGAVLTAICFTCLAVALSNSAGTSGGGHILANCTPTSSSEKVTVGGDTYQVEWLHHDGFDNPDWTKNWFKEGSSQVGISDGRLLITKPSGSGGEATIWFRRQLPANLIVRYKAKALGSDANNKCNLNQLTHATEMDGSPIKHGLRSGDYEEYHQIPNYIVTVTFDHSRVRRNPGFNQISESKDQARPDIEYNLTTVVKEGRVRYYINGRKVHDVQDMKPLPVGQFAIRTWNTTAWWDDFEFGRVLP